jgi:hypothetical protein
VVPLSYRHDPAFAAALAAVTRRLRSISPASRVHRPRICAAAACAQGCQQPPHSLKNAPGPPRRPAAGGSVARDAAAHAAAAVAAAAEPATEPAAVAAAVAATLAASGAAAAVAAADRADAVVWRRHDRRVGQPDRRVPHRRPGDAGRRERAGHALQWVQ